MPGILAQGLDPDAALTVYRNGAEALRIRRIGEAAKLTVRDDDRGVPRFRRWEPSQSRAEAAPMRQTAGGAYDTNHLCRRHIPITAAKSCFSFAAQRQGAGDAIRQTKQVRNAHERYRCDRKQRPHDARGRGHRTSTAAEEGGGFDKLLKFKRGEYYIGDDAVALGTRVSWPTRAWLKAWIKFSTTRWPSGEYTAWRVASAPDREELDELAEDDWPKGPDGKPSDPWVFQNLVPLENITSGEIVVFVSASIGGRQAVSELCQTICSTLYPRTEGRAERQPFCQGNADQGLWQSAAPVVCNCRLG